MILHTLSILNYKNISHAELSFSSKINCFIGNNGEGKTNILDAIHFLSFTRSATNTNDTFCIQHDMDSMMLSGRYELHPTLAPEQITCGLQRGRKKIFRRNQKAYKRLSEHIGLLPLILISPADNQLIIGGSEERRRFLDMVISQYSPAYLANLTRYNKALQQRNILLKQESPAPSIELLEAYEQVMAQTGEAIYQERSAFIEQLIPIFQSYYDHISQSHELVSLEYTSHCQRGTLLEVIQRDRFRDLAVGYSLHGIHRDDLIMNLGGHPIKQEGSQGQSKTYLISLKLAQFHFLQHTGSHTLPILLLDDIFDKLDAQRVEQIIRLVTENSFGQIFITDTNRDHLDQILSYTTHDYKLFDVTSGNIQELTNAQP